MRLQNDQPLPAIVVPRVGQVNYASQSDVVVQLDVAVHYFDGPVGRLIVDDEIPGPGPAVSVDIQVHYYAIVALRCFWKGVPAGGGVVLRVSIDVVTVDDNYAGKF